MRRIAVASDAGTTSIADPIGLKQLAELAGLSMSHVCRAFKTATGVSPHRWQLVWRL